MKKNKIPRFFLHLVFVLMTLVFIVPLVIAIMISVSTESDVLTFGYSIIPRHFSLEAYKILFQDASDLLRAYGVTILSSVVGSVLTVVLCASIAYALSQPQFTPRRGVMIYVLITMLFGGGLIPSYIINTQVLGIGNTIWIHILLGLVAGSNIILFKVFFTQIPASLIEAADIDGANQLQVLKSVIIPMSKPIIAMVFFNTFLGRWNNFENSMYYITDKKLYSLQYFLNNVISDAEFIREIYKMYNLTMETDIPVETLKFAICVAGALPVLVIFPFVQKYFSKGITMGAVKE